MPSYHQRLTEFAEKKRLQRLSDSIRDPSNPFCDACGSTLPRTLYVVKDLETARSYFLGDNCLKELLKRGAVSRRFARESGEEAYKQEMRLRSREETSSLPQVRPSTNATMGSFPIVLVSKTLDHYRAFVCYSSGQGISNWGMAEEARYSQEWHLGGEQGLLLEEKREEQKDAMIRCLVKAWDQAASSTTRTASPSADSFGFEIPASLLQVLHLAERALENDSRNQYTIDQSEASLIVA